VGGGGVSQPPFSGQEAGAPPQGGSLRKALVSSQDEFTRESMIADPERKMLAMTNIVKAALPSRSQVEILDSKALSLEVFRTGLARKKVEVQTLI